MVVHQHMPRAMVLIGRRFSSCSQREGTRSGGSSE
jgi:hypothetical protein